MGGAQRLLQPPALLPSLPPPIPTLTSLPALPLWPPKRPPEGAHEWAVFNDFCITPVPASEVMQWYGGQKRPCVLIYTQVGVSQPHCRLQ